MSAAFVPFEPHNDAVPPAIPAAGSDSAINTVPVRSPDRPIRFPHIPSIDQTPPGMAHYLQRQHQALRIDTPHPPLGQAAAVQSPAGPLTKGPWAGVATPPKPGTANSPPRAPMTGGPGTGGPVTDRVSQTPSPLVSGQSFPATQPASPASSEIADTRAQPIPVRPSSPSRDSWRSLSTQVEQIAEYLRRRRNELETEQTDLKLNALMQEAALLQEREQLRGQQLNIQMVQATLEILRRQLLEFGNSLSESLPADHQLLHQFEAVCQAYYDAAGVARLLDVN